MKLLKSILIFEHKIWRIKSFFRRPPRWKIISVSKPTGIITVLRRHSIQLKKSFTRLKIAFQETAQEYFLSSKFNNVLSTFFVDHLDGNLALFQNLQSLSQYYAGPHFIWESPSPDWMSLFMKLLKSILIFEHKIWRIKCFFRRPPRRKIISVSKPTGITTVLSRLSTQLKSPSLDWISLFMRLNKSILNFEHKIWRIKSFFRRPPRRKIISVSKPTEFITVLRRPSFHLRKSFTRLNNTFHETAQEYFNFWAQNLTY